MQISKQHKEGLEWTISVVIPAEEMQKEIHKKMQETAQRARIDGFRPGKIPLKVIEQKFGLGIRAETAEKQLQASLRDAFVSEKLRPAGTPQLDIKENGMEGALSYEATFEVYPEVSLDKLSEIKVTRLQAEISDADIVSALERLQKNFMDWEEVNRPAQQGDRVTVDYLGDMQEVPEAQRTGKEQKIILGAGRMIPGFEDQIIGMQVNQEKDIHVTFPEGYHEASLANKPATFHITMHKVEAPKMPAIDDALCEKVGIKEGGVDALRERMRTELANHAQIVAREKVKQELLDQLLATHPVILPKALVKQEMEFLHDVRHPEPHDHEHGHTEEEMHDLKQEAERKVALSLLLGEYVRLNQIQADEQTMMTKAVEIMRRQFGQLSPEMLRYFMQDENQRNMIRSFVLEEKAVDKLLADAVQVVEQPISFKELVEEGQ
ncbi:MAG: trigger factor [Gammaproteobacteria bacterium]